MRVLLAILFWAALVLPARAQEITIAAAADLRPALEEIASHFQALSAAHIKTIYGSSGNFYQQIQNGAPFDLFFSANTDYPKKLESAGLTVPGTYYEYARGKIVLLVSANSKLDLKRGLNVLLDPTVQKIAIADPSHAPYGQAAVAALKAENIYDQVSPKFVTGENISQTVSFVLSGAAAAGIVALSLALTPSTSSQVRFAEIPAHDYSPIQQACVVLRSSKNQSYATQFQSYVRSRDAATIFERYGFEVPADKAKPVQ
jgi:molybdate transport system substrate-binding protein